MEAVDNSYVEIDSVRIKPSKIVFMDAFEGRKYKEQITIQNISSSRIFLRITAPSSYAFQVKCIPRGMYISPGLTISKYIKFTYTHCSTELCFLPIYINEKRYDYHMSVRLSAPIVQFVPDNIHFGTIDAGFTSAVRMLQLQNIGSKATRFYIDLTRNQQLQLIVDPNKGILQPRSSTNIQIRLLAYKEGELSPEMWIKCETPLRVPVQGVVITPKFESVHPNAISKFTLLDFPVTYVGNKCTQSLLIRNYSANRAMFCVLEDHAKEIGDASADDENVYRHFTVYPTEGRLEPKEARIFQFAFNPQKSTRLQDPPDFYFCVFEICKIDCKDLYTKDYSEPIFSKAREKFSPTDSTRQSANSLVISLDANSDTEIQSFEDNYSDRDSDVLGIGVSKNIVRVYLHAVAETAHVSVIPDELVLANLHMGQQEKRILEFENLSKKLPVILRYKKVSYVDMEFNRIFLKPSEKLQVSVIITPYRIGTVNTKLHFDLMFYDYPKTNDEYKIVGLVSVSVVFDTLAVTNKPPPKFTTGLTPNYIKEVGMHCDDVRFNTLVRKPKTAVISNIKSASASKIAFPNDRPKSTRPWRSSVQCKTLFTGLPRYIPPCNSDYELTVFDREFNHTVTKYYIEYSRRECARLKKLHGKKTIEQFDYLLTDETLLLCSNMKCKRRANYNAGEHTGKDCFLPLTPSQLNKVIVYPQTVQTGEIATHYRYNFKVKIKNTNPFAIRVFIKSDKPNFLYPDLSRKIVKSNSEIEVNMVYLTTSVGLYTSAIDFIINECNVFVVTMLSDVVSKILKLNTHHINFNENETRKYVEIRNNLNTPILFYWEVPHQNFAIDPQQGYVQPKRMLTCAVTYMSYQPGPAITEIEFFSGDKKVQQVMIAAPGRRKNYYFYNERIIFPDVSLNMPVIEKAIFRNGDSKALSYKIINPNPLEGISIYPAEGIVRENSEWVLYITVKITACISFSCCVKMEIVRSKTVQLFIDGNVIYPDITVFPKQLHFKKIPSSSFDSLQFTIENKSSNVVLLDFDMSDYQEYKISNSQDYWLSELQKSISIEAGQSRNLYLHYLPSDVASSTFYLPLITNDIIGPPLNTDKITTKVVYFIKHAIENATPVTIPTQLVCVSVQTYTTEPKIKFSSSNLNFQFVPTSKNCITQRRIYISNIRKDSEDICIRTDDLKLPFRLEYESGSPITRFESSIVCSLNPNEQVVLKAMFEPETHGYYESILPIYLRSDYSTKIHNNFVLTGTYPKPLISHDPPALYFKPAPIHITTTALLTLTLRYHKKNCVMETSSNLPNLSVIIPDDYYIEGKSSDEYTVKLISKYTPEESQMYTAVVIISCSCGGRCELPLKGVSENCYLTTHAFVETLMTVQYPQDNMRRYTSADLEFRQSILSIMTGVTANRPEDINMTEFFNSYPSFPEDHNCSFTNYMNSIVSIFESWMYTQGFYGKMFYKIPEGIKLLCDPPETDKSNTNPKQVLCIVPYVQLLINLAGPKMKSYLNLSFTPTDNTEKVNYLYSVYEKALAFVKENGAYIPHVQPEYLLEYKYYKDYIENKYADLPESEKQSDNILDSDKYYLLTKQVWLDLITQTYKIFILNRLNTKAYNLSRRSSLRNKIPSRKFSMKLFSSVQYDFIYSDSEKMLLDWLCNSYNAVRKSIWGDHECIGHRDTNAFDHNLLDGFVFAGVTVAYCPYLESKFRNLYLCPSSYEELLHNNIMVTQAWDMLNFSFEITPQELVKSNTVQIIMLSAYLFEVLPTLSPSEIIEFSVGLSLTTTKTFKLKNENDFEVAYKVIFVNNDNECFSTNETDLILTAQKEIKINIKYTAKFLKSIRATLVLSGEYMGYTYAKSKAVTLIGLPDVSYMSTVLTLPAYLYKVTEVTSTCLSPYATAGSYKVQISMLKPEDLNDIQSWPYSNQIPKLSSVSFCSLNEEFVFDDNGLCTINGLTCAVCPGNSSIWLIFRNSDIGDFFLQINTVVKVTKTVETLNVIIPRNFIDNNYYMENNNKNAICLEIPRQNRAMLDAIKEMILKIMEGEEIEFWKKNIHTTTGMHLLQKMISEDKSSTPTDMQRIFKKNTTYIIKPDKDTLTKLQYSVVIEDECGSGYVNVPLIFADVSTFPQNFSFSMQSEDGLKRRYYMTNFLYDKD